MLYIDEPNQVGLSYDTPTNCTVLVADEGEISLKPTDFSSGLPQLNLTSRVGTFSSQNSTHTANGTAQAAHAIWHFAQTFFSEFPHYKPADEKISLWAESYGGHYGPAFMRFFQQQNEKIANGTIDEEHAHYLHLDTLGIVNGLLDALIQEEAYISFPYNNVRRCDILPLVPQPVPSNTHHRPTVYKHSTSPYMKSYYTTSPPPEAAKSS